MYKVLAICGSRRKKGNTISLLKQMQEAYLMWPLAVFSG